MMNDTSYSQCIARDIEREKRVGSHVITDMAFRYNYLGLKKIVVCDIDGTVADLSHRLQYAKGPEKNWDTFFSLLDGDTPRRDIYAQVRELADREGADLVFVTARPEKYREATRNWLIKHDHGKFVHIIMRRDNDKRVDTEVKEDIYNQYLKQYEIVGVFDDRPSVIRMWQRNGLDVIDCGNGEEF
jgi:hypothetical protein